ncbi:MAG: methyltransferase domain-containing protein [Rhodospirillales bacterium]|mgnify:FL=1|jgi:SAM-dependent methyltransferase|nr:methyltransferase domain-containing protein [Rhodospirillales bacterium]MBT5075839.1 methyltransferase domain-containing protein [Rhodospirillales bacterium]MBT6801549.1 methyltransferase domain-containing protein [Rhodospirillales bacterium]MBT7526095.1 methyltransferase domain-containing protein [Rhodospirillales bacterium]MBT7898920.1 methyltransferase domain-containing protein [Rhodospirillales bacterium]
MNVASALMKVLPFGKKDPAGLEPGAESDEAGLEPTADGGSDSKGDAPAPGEDEGENNLITRIMAWWEGQDVDEYKQLKAVADAEKEVEDADGEPALKVVAGGKDKTDQGPQAYWNPSRILVAELLWGEGEVIPGGSERTMEMVSSFGIQKETNVLNIGAGLGGAIRDIAKKFDVWVSAYEADAELAQAGVEMSIKAGLSKKAEIEHADMENLTVREEHFACAFSREALYMVKDKEKLLTSVQEGLKMDSSLLITDYVVAEGRADDPAIAKWKEVQSRPIYLWSPAEAQEMLRQLNFEVRVDQDITAQVRGDIFAGWEKFITSHERDGVPPQLQQALLETATDWAYCVEAMDSGALLVYRLVAIKK